MMNLGSFQDIRAKKSSAIKTKMSDIAINRLTILDVFLEIDFIDHDADGPKVRFNLAFFHNCSIGEGWGESSTFTNYFLANFQKDLPNAMATDATVK